MPKTMQHLQQSVAGPEDVLFERNVIFAANTPFWKLPKSAFKFSVAMTVTRGGTTQAHEERGALTQVKAEPSLQGQAQPAGQSHDPPPVQGQGQTMIQGQAQSSGQGQARGNGQGQAHAEGQAHGGGQASEGNDKDGLATRRRLLVRADSDSRRTSDCAMETIAFKTEEAASAGRWWSPNSCAHTVCFWLQQFNEHLAHEFERHPKLKKESDGGPEEVVARWIQGSPVQQYPRS